MANFFISKAPDVEQILISMESQEDMLADAHSLGEIFQGVTLPARISQLASEIWSYMNLNLTSKALETFHNVLRHEGFEAFFQLGKLAKLHRVRVIAVV